jgi:formylglycine-generating enzyme required for sulfatase activity
MPRISIRVCLLAVLLASVVAPAWAQKRMALVIGNETYTYETKLGNPVKDAVLISRTLRGLGFAVDERTNLTKREMTQAIAKFARESAGADTALVYFAGHGMQPSNGGRNYLLPVDANIENDDALDSDGYPADRVVEQMERNANPAKLRLVVLDACRNNPRAGRTRGSVRGLSRMNPGDDYTLIAFSTNDQDVADDGSGSNSPYAEALARHLARAKELPMRRIFELTATDVRNATKQKQRPRTYGDLDSRVGLDGVLLASVVPEPVPQPAQGSILAQVEQQAWDAAQRANTLAGYEAYLSEYPKGRFVAAARVARAGLSAQTNVGNSAGGAGTDKHNGRFRASNDCPEMQWLPSGVEPPYTGLSTIYSKDGLEVDWNKFERMSQVAVSVTDVTAYQFSLFLEQTSYMPGKCFDNVGTSFSNWKDVAEYFDPRPMIPLFSSEYWRTPVVCMSVLDAEAYAAWLSSKGPFSYRLPTVKELMYFRRIEYPALDKNSTDLFKFGNFVTLGKIRPDWKITGEVIDCKDPVNNKEWTLARVGLYEKGRFGTADLIGNTVKLTSDINIHKRPIVWGYDYTKVLYSRTPPEVVWTDLLKEHNLTVGIRLVAEEKSK